MPNPLALRLYLRCASIFFWVAVFIGSGRGFGAEPVHAPVLRKFPYPYRAAMTITSDIDSCSREEFLEVHQFLNTHEDTSKNTFATQNTNMGLGVGLDIGDSFFPYTDVNSQGWSFTYFKGMTAQKSADADFIRTFAHAGYIDAMHSYGDISNPNGFTRQMAIDALAEFRRERMNITIFSNHGPQTNTNNIGGIWKGSDPAAPQHHTDLTIYPRGPVLFVSNGSTTSGVGWDKPLKVMTLRDKTKTFVFMRYLDNNLGWHVDALSKQLTTEHLDALEHKEGYWIVANHFGMRAGGRNVVPVFSEDNRRALRQLEWRFRSGAIYVTTAARLLWYSYVHDYLAWAQKKISGGRTLITIAGVKSPAYGAFIPTFDDLRGITFYTDEPENVVVSLNGENVTERLRINPPDYRGTRSISFPTAAPPPLPEWISDGTTQKTEDYRIEDFNYAFGVTNLGEKAFSPTLTYIGLHPFRIASARAGAAYCIYLPDDKHVRLPRVAPGGTLSGIKVINGPPDPALPRLTGVSNPAIEVAEASYTTATQKLRIVLQGNGATTLTLRNWHVPSVRVEVRGEKIVNCE